MNLIKTITTSTGGLVVNRWLHPSAPGSILSVHKKSFAAPRPTHLFIYFVHYFFIDFQAATGTAGHPWPRFLIFDFGYPISGLSAYPADCYGFNSARTGDLLLSTVETDRHRPRVHKSRAASFTPRYIFHPEAVRSHRRGRIHRSPAICSIKNDNYSCPFFFGTAAIKFFIPYPPQKARRLPLLSPGAWLSLRKQIQKGPSRCEGSRFFFFTCRCVLFFFGPPKCRVPS